MNLAYVAGLVDGEGCIGFTQIRANLVPRICITNTNKELIEILYGEFGGCIRYQKRIKPGWKESFHWVATSNIAMTFLNKVQKYLILKHPQATCLQLYESIRPGKGKRWTADSKDARDLLKRQIAWLNKKGNHNEMEPINEVLKEMGYTFKKK